MAQVEIGYSLQEQRVDAGAGINRGFGTVIGNRVVARPGIDDISTAAAYGRAEKALDFTSVK